MPLRTMARMTAFRPGQSPPPVNIPIFIVCSGALIQTKLPGMHSERGPDSGLARGAGSAVAGKNKIITKPRILSPVRWRQNPVDRGLARRGEGRIARCHRYFRDPRRLQTQPDESGWRVVRG